MLSAAVLLDRVFQEPSCLGAPRLGPPSPARTTERSEEEKRTGGGMEAALVAGGKEEACRLLCPLS